MRFTSIKLALLLLLLPTLTWAMEQPPYKIQDPAVNENFNEIYREMDQHKHNEDDSSKLEDVIPSSGATYDLGSPTRTWANAYVKTLKFNDGTSMTSAVGASASTSNVSYGVIMTTVGSNTNQIKLSADAIDIMGDFYTLISTIGDMSVSGIAGRDSGLSDSTNTWVSVFLCSNGSTVTVVLSSVTQTYRPTSLPTGFTKWRLIGHFFNDGSANVRPIYWVNGVATLISDRALLDLSNLTITLNNLDLTSEIPPGAKRAHFNIIADGEIVTTAGLIIFHALGMNPVICGSIGVVTDIAFESNVSGDFVSSNQTVEFVGQRIIIYGESVSGRVAVFFVALRGWEE